MNTRLIAIVGAAMFALGLFLLGWHLGTKNIQADWSAAKVAQAAADAEANRANRVIESKRNATIIEAQNAATFRNKSLQVAAADSRAVADGLRDDIATIRRSLPGLADDAVRERADAVAAVLSDCSREYADMAAAADRHASDVRTLMEAWPK
jgi:hypothetical protein